MQKIKGKQEKLQKILSKHFLKFSLVPIFVVEVALVVLYFSINSYISSKNTELLLAEAKLYSKTVLENEANIISDKLSTISRINTQLQREHEKLFENPSVFGLPNGNPKFNIAPNGVFYKENKIGSSLYYSSKTKITEKEKQKAIFTEAMDISLKSVVDINPNIVASYFNSWDDMNRLYPFIDDVAKQYGEHIHMEDYNFYYLADNKHNPTKKATWTSAYLDPAGNGWMLSSLVPIYNNGFLEGVTGLDISIDVFVKNVLDKKLPYNANLFMVDEKGMIIAMSEEIENLLGLKELKEHLYTDAILKTVEKPEEFNLITNKSDSAKHFKNILENNIKEASFGLNGKDYLVYEQDVNETGWKLLVLIDKKNIFSSIEILQNLSNKIGYAAIAFLLLFYIVFFYLLLKRTNEFSDSITTPITKLSKQTSKIMNMNNEIKVLDTNIEEIDKLSNNFVNMIGVLNERTIKLYEAKEVAEESNKSKDEFLANISHELKTPLNSINIISSIMKKNSKENLDEKDVKSIEIINNCGKDLLLLVNDLLDLTEIDKGTLEVNNDKIILKDFFDKLYNKFSEQANAKSLNLSLNIDSTISVINSDDYRLNQIIDNLLSNSIKFTNKGNISLNVKDDSEYIRILVKDDGIGISENQLATIFDRFKQVDGSTSRKYGGTGLGLSITKELVSLLKGKIFVNSEINIGTTFEIILPKNVEITQEKSKIIQSSKIVDEIIPAPKESVKKVEKVLILNNNPITFIIMIVELRKKYEVIQATNINEFLKINSSDNISKAILDTSTLKNDEIVSLKENVSNNFVMIYKDNLEEELEKKSILKIEKNEIKKSISQI
ncbi:sensor histidine kinase [Arcobacter peruensis]|uniref:sensor histidine kinase n=1 Tax=Arcobacter peruensis TaxID=2320140 RepID=UPI000F097E56|nr:sensor histidine kinase [Arcobacter peruensis]